MAGSAPIYLFMFVTTRALKTIRKLNKELVAHIQRVFQGR